MKSKPLVSVIMNCYNGEEFLKKAIDSVYSQTYKNWEIIFWDNQSTDKSAELAKDYDGKLKYFYAPKHTGLYEARNYAIEKASGEFYAFLDMDDWWDHKKLALQIRLFKDPEIGLVYGNYWYVNEVENSIGKMYKKQLPTGRITNDLLKKYTIGLLTIVVRKEVYDSLDEQFNKVYSLSGDFDFVVRMSLRCKFNCVQEPIAYYRFHGNNISIKHKNRVISELEKWIYSMNKFPEISEQPMFHLQKEKLMYLKVIKFIFDNKRSKALSEALLIPFGIFKIKSLFILMLPVKIILLMRS